jgi:hypothetical protein
MFYAKRGHNGFRLSVLMSVGVAVLASSALGVQTPHAIPPTHARQCVPTGEIPPGDVRTITVTWKHPFATGAYAIIGSVAEAGDDRLAIELGHIVMPHTPTEAAAVVFNRDASAAESGVLCLDASLE